MQSIAMFVQNVIIATLSAGEDLKGYVKKGREHIFNFIIVVFYLKEKQRPTACLNAVHHASAFF